MKALAGTLPPRVRTWTTELPQAEAMASETKAAWGVGGVGAPGSIGAAGAVGNLGYAGVRGEGSGVGVLVDYEVALGFDVATTRSIMVCGLFSGTRRMAIWAVLGFDVGLLRGRSWLRVVLGDEAHGDLGGGFGGDDGSGLAALHGVDAEGGEVQALLQGLGGAVSVEPRPNSFIMSAFLSGTESKHLLDGGGRRVGCRSKNL